MNNGIAKFVDETSFQYCPNIPILLWQIAGESPEISFRWDGRVRALVIAVSSWQGSKRCMGERFLDPDLLTTARGNVIAMEIDDLISHLNDRVRLLELKTSGGKSKT